MLIVCREASRSLEGLALQGDNLFVAVAGDDNQNMPDSIKIYDKTTMTYRCGYPVTGGVGQIYADNKHGLWMMRGKRIIRMDAMSGRLLPQSLTIPEEVTALSFSIDTYNNRLLLPNRGKDMRCV